MNIIQVQDRLKGLPEDMLVNYVKNPTGSVPIYLALGEINRRREMEAKFKANQEEKANIKDQLISGLGGMNPRQMDPRQMTPEMLASNGVGALPTKTMEFKEGGIIGYTKNKFGKMGAVYEDGSQAFYGQGIVAGLALLDKARKFGKPLYDRFGKPIVDKTSKYLKDLKKKRKTKQFKKDAKEGFGTKPKPKTTKDGKPKPKTTKGDKEVDIGGGIFPGGGGIDKTAFKLSKGILSLPYRNPVVVGGSLYYFRDEIKTLWDEYFNEDGTKKKEVPPNVQEKIDNEIKNQPGETETDKETPFVTPQLDTDYDMSPAEYGQSRADAYRKRIGTDPNLAKVATRLEELEGRAGDTRESALNRALILGGLTMAGTESPNFLSALSEGAMGGVEAYGEEMDKAEGIEDKAFELDLAINQAKRKEDIAIETFGMKSEEAERARRETRELENKKLQLQKFGYDTSLKVAETTSGMYGLGAKINEKIAKDIAGNKNYQLAEMRLIDLQRALKANPGDEKLIKQIQQQQKIMLGIEQRIKARYPTYGGGSQSSASINVPDSLLDLINKEYSGNKKTTTNPKTSTNPKTEPDDSFDVDELIDSVQTIGGNLYDDAVDLGGDLYDKGDKFITDLLK